MEPCLLDDWSHPRHRQPPLELRHRRHHVASERETGADQAVMDLVIAGARRLKADSRAL